MSDYLSPRSIQELDLECPVLPRTLLEAFELAQQPEGPEVKQVTDLVHHDPAVAARLLRIVNSAFYGQRGEIQSVRRAVVVLGPSSVLGLVMSMSVMGVRASLDEKTAAPFLNLVRHSIATSYLATRLIAIKQTDAGGRVQEEDMTSEVLTAAIMHDFGKVILLYNFPEKAVSFYQQPITSGWDMLRAESLLFGYNHVETGVYLARKLKLPEALADVIAYHHDSAGCAGCSTSIRNMVAAVAVASLAANALGYSLNHTVSWDACREEPVWVDFFGEDPENSGRMVERIEQMSGDLAAYVDALI